MDIAPVENGGNNLEVATTNLKQAYRQFRAGESVDPREVADNLTAVFNTTDPKTRGKNPDLLMIFRKCGPLTKDPKTKQSLITNPQMLKLIDPEKYKEEREKKKNKIKRVILAGTGIGAWAGVGATVYALNSSSYDPQPPSQPTAYTIEAPPQPKIAEVVPWTATPTQAAEPTATAPATATQIPTKTPTKEPTATQTASPTPTVDVAEQAKKESGNINAAEYFLNNLVKMFKEKRLERVKQDPSFAERIDSEFLNSDSINLLYLGIDNTREREGEFNPQGFGRSDVTMLITFNPKTFQINAVSFPRDMFAPELTSFKFIGGARINAATMAPLVDPKVDSFELARKIMETATGLPIDGVIKTNIDFTQGWTDDNGQTTPGVLDDLFPQGLKIHVPYTVTDSEYPTAHYGSKKLVITEGDHVMNGRQLTELGRSRHSGSDFDRSERQRLIGLAALKQLLPEMFLKDFPLGKTDALDRMIAALEKQQQLTNLSSDLNLVEILKIIKGGALKLRQNPKGLATLALLAANSKDVISNMMQNKDNVYNSLGLTRPNGLVANVEPNEPFFWDYMLKVSGSSTTAQPTKLGNHLKYWQPIRKYIKESLRR